MSVLKRGLMQVSNLHPRYANQLHARSVTSHYSYGLMEMNKRTVMNGTNLFINEKGTRSVLAGNMVERQQRRYLSDYFDRFDISNKTYKIDLKEMEKKYKEIQKVLHPDVVSASSAASSDVTSSDINRAYDVLKSPTLRAKYLLHLKHSPQTPFNEDDDDNHSKSRKAKNDVDKELLMYIMEKNEEIEENSSSEKELLNVRKDVENDLSNVENEFEEAINKDDLKLATKLADSIQYHFRLIEQINKHLYQL